MINKKLLAVVSIAATIATSSAFAKTEGNYVGLDLLGTQYKIFNTDNSRNDEMDYGIGVNYKYAFNFNNFFVAPSVFYNYNNAAIRDKGSDFKSELKYSYGVKSDFGYDITDKFAPFVTLGFQQSRHETSSGGVSTLSDTLEEVTYGVGAKYSVTSNVDVALAYEYANYTASGTANSINPEIFKLGVAYKF